MKTLCRALLCLLALNLLAGCATQHYPPQDQTEEAAETRAVMAPAGSGGQARAAEPGKPLAQALSRESDLSDHQVAALKQNLGKDAFDQTGQASWTDLPGQGQGGLTAAHATLPVGSKVEVTNLDNSRRTVVMITDRSPQSGRIMDLSRTAAEALGISGSGVATVGLRVLDRPKGKAAAKAVTKKPPSAPKVKAKPQADEDVAAVSPEDRITADEAAAPAPSKKKSKTPAAKPAAAPTAKAQAKTQAAAKPAPAPAAKAQASGSGKYFVQVGSFASKDNAQALAKRLKAQGYAGSRVVPSVKDGKTLYRVQAGAFADKAQAGAAQGALKGEFPSGYVLGD